MNVIGIDIGGTKCAVSRLIDQRRVEETHRFATTTREGTLEALRLAVASLRLQGETVFGISCGGPLDAAHGVILCPPNLPGWENTDIVRFFTSHFGGTAVLMNDANACALAEWRFGAGRGTRHMVFLTAGTGLGGGLILNGDLYEGATGDAGEAGHVRLAAHGPIGYGKVGSFEGFCSGGGIARLAEIFLGESSGPAPAWAQTRPLSAKSVAEAASAGDALALRVMQESGRRLGEGLALLIDILNPERIVIGGIYPRCHELLTPSMQTALQREALETPLAACSVVPAELGETIGSHGAICVALRALEQGRASVPQRRVG
ncbi:MAG: ROK family protein [Verrucomicrobiota bacterium]